MAKMLKKTAQEVDDPAQKTTEAEKPEQALSTAPKTQDNIEAATENETRRDENSLAQTKFISEAMRGLLNEQVAYEMQSAYIYMAAGAWFQAKGLTGYSSWMARQADDEIGHAKKVLDYLMDTGTYVGLPSIPAPSETWERPTQVTRAILDHEMEVTQRWQKIHIQAKEDNDAPTTQLAHGFLEEQIEEEDGALTLHQRTQMSKDNPAGLLVLDVDLMERDPSQKAASYKKAEPLAAEEPAMKPAKDQPPQGKSEEADITSVGDVAKGKPQDIEKDVTPEVTLKPVGSEADKMKSGMSEVTDKTNKEGEKAKAVNPSVIVTERSMTDKVAASLRKLANSGKPTVNPATTTPLLRGTGVDNSKRQAAAMEAIRRQQKYDRVAGIPPIKPLAR